MTIQHSIREMWWLEPYHPLRIEHENREQWRIALQVFRSTPALRLSKLVCDADDTSGHFIVDATYLVPLDNVESSTCDCILCHRPVMQAEQGVIGFAFHKECLSGEISPDRADELLLVAEQLTQVKSWMDLAPL